MATTGERLTIIETDLKYIKEKIDEQNKEIKLLKTLMEDNNKCLDDKYATKQIETVVYSLCGIILMAVVTMGLKLVLGG